jgi:hypothetical protein
MYIQQILQRSEVYFGVVGVVGSNPAAPIYGILYMESLRNQGFHHFREIAQHIVILNKG